MSAITPEMKSDFNSIVELIIEMYELEGRKVYQHISERALALALAYKRKYLEIQETEKPKKAPRYDLDDDGFSEELDSFDVLSEFIKDEKVRYAINTNELNKEFREWVDSIPDGLWNQTKFEEEWIDYVRMFLEFKYGPPSY